MAVIGRWSISFILSDTYHDTHEVIFDMYQRYILFGFRPKKLDIFGNFNDQNTLQF